MAFKFLVLELMVRVELKLNSIKIHSIIKQIVFITFFKLETLNTKLDFKNEFIYMFTKFLGNQSYIHRLVYVHLQIF
jgi:hypothetical protein